MRNNTVLDVQHSGNLGGKEVRASFDEEAIVHLMSVLTDLYSDPIGTVIREYSTNARDAHAEAGTDAPIQVTLPNALNPNFTVEDFGVGLSYDGLSDTYLKYGRSTKRETDEQTGTLGLGSKSAWTYTAMFTVTAVKDGLKTVAVLLRGEDGAGRMRVQDTVTTDAPNGVKVVIPVSDVDEFNERARKFFSFWRPGTVLVNGEEPATLDGTWLDDDILLTSEVDDHYVVMGGVAYPVSRYEFSGMSPVSNRYVVAWVPMGAVNFTPNREALNYSNLTLDTLRTIRTYVADVVRAGVQGDLDNAADATEALTLTYGKHWDVIRSLGFKTFHYQGKALPDTFYMQDPYARLYDGERASKVNYIEPRNVLPGSGKDYAIVYNHGNKSFPATNREKLAIYCDENGITNSRFVLVNKRFGAPWTDHLEAIDWNDVAGIKVEREKRERSKNAPAYRVLTGGNKTDRQTDLDDYDRIVFLSPSDYMSTETAYTVFNNDTTAVVLLNKNRWDKFKRDYPQAQHVRAALPTVAQEFLDTLTEGDVYYLSTTSWGRANLTGFDPNDLLDPELAAVVRALRGFSNLTQNKWSTIERAYWGHHEKRPALPDDTLTAKVEAMTDRYPLLAGNDRYSSDARALTEYVNALYTVKYQTEEN